MISFYIIPEGTDYKMVSQNLTLESGFAAGTCIPLVLTVIKDGVLESDETLQLSASDASSHAMPSSDHGGTTLITIVDDDSACKWHMVRVMCFFLIYSAT